jgi:hypothetical protein
MPPGDPGHARAHRMGRLAAHVGVHLVEHQHRHLVLVGQHGLQCQHHPGELAAGGDGL